MPLACHQGHRGCPWGEVGRGSSAQSDAATIAPRGSVPAICMDPTPLYSFITELAGASASRRSSAALPARARVSEPALPLVLATLHRSSGAGCWSSFPRTPTRATQPRGRRGSWAETSALFPSRGVSHASGLEPPPHLVGERARALDILVAGGLVCASAAAVAEGMPPPAARPRPVRLVIGEEPGLDGLAEALASAGYERVDRVDERGQFAVRGGIVDVFPSTGREPLRVELFGDEIEQVRAFSPFTQRALHTVTEASVYPAAERRGRARRSPWRSWEDETPSARSPRRPRAAASTGARLRLAARRGARRLGRGGAHAGLARGCDGAGPVPARAGIPVRSAAAGDRGPRPRRSGERARRIRALRESRRRHVPAPGRGPAAGRAPAQGREHDPPEPATRCPGRRRSASPSRRRGAASSGASSASCSCPDTQVFRKRAPARRRAARPCARRRSPTCASATTSSTRTTASGSCSASRRRPSPASRATISSSRFRGEDRLYVPHEQLGKLSRYIGADAKSPTLSKLGGKAWQNLKTARARVRARARRRAARALRAAAAGRRRALRPDNEWLERLEATFPFGETDDQARAIEAVKEDLESPRPMDRLVCGDVGFGKTEVARARRVRASPSTASRCSCSCPTTILAEQHWNTFRERFRDFPVNVEMVSRFRKPAETKKVLADFAAGKVDVLVGTHRVLSRDVIPKELGLVDPRRGAALRRRPEGAAASATARSRRARPLRDADPAHAAHVARRACATSRSSRRRPRAAARSGRTWASTTRS